MRGGLKGISLTAALFCSLAMVCLLPETASASPTQSDAADSTAQRRKARKGARAGTSQRGVTAGAQAGSKVGSQPAGDLVFGFVESFDPEKKTIMVRLNEQQLKKITGQPQYAWYFSKEGVPEAKDFKLKVRLNDDTLVRVRPELQGTLFAVQEGEAINVQGQLKIEDPDKDPDSAFGMMAEVVTLASITCTPGRCLSGGDCNKKCNNNNCMCKKK